MARKDLDDPTVSSPQHRNKAKRLRKKLRAGEASDDEKAWIAGYEAHRSGEAGDDTPADGAEDLEDGDANADPGGDAPAADREAAPPPPPPSSPPLGDAIPPPPPPRVNLGDDAPPPPKGKAASAQATPVPDGRAEFIGFLTSQWEGAMTAMTDELATIGVAPILPVDVIKPAVHATIDGLIPKSFKATPPMVAAVGTTAITAQYYFNRKKLAEKKRAAAAKDANPRTPDPTGEKVAAMEREDELARERARKADEAKAAAIDAKLGTPPAPGWDAKRDVTVPAPPHHNSTPPPEVPPPTQLELVRTKATKEAEARELAALAGNPDARF